MVSDRGSNVSAVTVRGHPPAWAALAKYPREGATIAMMAASNAMSISPTKSQPVISQEALKQLLQEFKAEKGENFHLTTLGYFGSYARGEASPDSDIDIVFKTDYPNLLLTSRLRLDLVELLKRPVDVIRYRENMNPGLKDRLDREAIYV